MSNREASRTRAAGKNSSLIDAVKQRQATIKRRRDEQLAADVCSQLFETYLESFRTSKNPLYVWGAWQLARKNGVELPQWAASAFDEMASNLIALAKKRPKRDVATHAGRALGFAGDRKGANAFGMIAELARDEEFLAMYLGERVRGENKTTAIQRVADEMGAEPKTVRRRIMTRLRQLGLTLQGFEGLPGEIDGWKLLAHIAKNWQAYVERRSDK